MATASLIGTPTITNRSVTLVGSNTTLYTCPSNVLCYAKIDFATLNASGTLFVQTFDVATATWINMVSIGTSPSAGGGPIPYPIQENNGTAVSTVTSGGWGVSAAQNRIASDLGAYLVMPGDRIFSNSFSGFISFWTYELAGF